MNPLAPLGKIYAVGVDIRNAMFDRGWFRSYDLGAPTISIGNLTAGGTGKTPLVAAIAKILLDQGEKVCILTRGYGRQNARSRVLVSDGANVLADADTGGDEPVELARQLGGKAVIIADADRVAAAKWAREKFGITAFILDDGFQHRRARRNLDIVCIDATRPCGNGHVIPAGTLRESFKHLSRADAIVVTRANMVESTDDLVARLRNRNAAVPIFLASNRIIKLTKLSDPTAEVANVGRVVAFCGLGNPENFFAQLQQDGVEVAATEAFPDHHRYAASDIRQLEKLATKHSAKALVTTAKDAVKLRPADFATDCYVANISTDITNSDAFASLLSQTLR